MSLYEEDVTEDQFILAKNFTLSGDKYSIDVDLSKIGRSKGHDYFEGWEQELYAKVEILESKATIQSKVVNVDVRSFKPDVPDGVSFVKVGKPEDKKGEKRRLWR